MFRVRKFFFVPQKKRHTYKLPIKIKDNFVIHVFLITLRFNSGANDDDPIAQQIQDAEAKAPEDLTEDDKMVLLGRPKNGDVIRAQLRVKESKEFKVSRWNSTRPFCYFSLPNWEKKGIFMDRSLKISSMKFLRGLKNQYPLK